MKCRQPGIVEFGDLMIKPGCYQALNLDGGGSTTMVVEDRFVNSPSDASGERLVANVLLVVKKKNPTMFLRISLQSFQRRLLTSLMVRCDTNV